jgi:hypothetical protein
MDNKIKANIICEKLMILKQEFRLYVQTKTSSLFDIAEKQNHCGHEWPIYRKDCQQIQNRFCGSYDSI